LDLTLKDIVGLTEQVMTILAIVLGGAWAYFNFIKGRVYHPRLEPRVSAVLKPRPNFQHVLINTEVKNVGLSNVPIQKEGTAIRLLALTQDNYVKTGWEIDWEDHHLVTLSVFESHGWIEPGETIREQRLIPLREEGLLALRVEVRIVSKGIEWNDATTIDATPPVTNSEATTL
jgi:hypothetical protein